VWRCEHQQVESENAGFTPSNSRKSHGDARKKKSRTRMADAAEKRAKNGAQLS
jgi:hypothetical protein